MKSYFSIFTFLLFLGCTNNSTKENNTADTSQPKRTSTEFIKSKDSLISLLPGMKSDRIDCDANIYWRIIKRGKSSIPLLIESLTDTTLTHVYDPCKKGRLNVSEVSYFALEEIAEFPAFVVTDIQFDVYDQDGCSSFFDYLFDNKNKTDYQKKVRSFYDSNKFVYVQFEDKDLSECRRKYHILGKLKWQE
ncbi:MAG: hypothetical protein HOP30_07405 [Cyclobacteriaceae bacterium]|nr:hypothetical protein [Cyclobacteriaceae bacterium]